METMNKIWNWFDGKKTSFGAILLIACGIPNLEKWVSPDVIEAVYYVGSMLGAGGVIHRITKTVKK